MAKKKEVVITCNATNVKAVIEGLERGMAALAKEEENLLNVIKQRGYAENEEKKRLKELERAMDAMRTNVQKNREEQKKLAEVMKDLSGAKLKDLKKALQEGKAALNNMSARDPGRQKLVSDLQRIQKQIEANTGALKSHGSAWQSAVKNITAYVGVFGAFNFVKNKITEVIRGGAELSDQMAQVRMVSGLAMEDIEDLTRTLAKMDTRTTLSELERIAYAGAKLGFGEYGTKGLEEFARAANQVNVALREDLGEEALTALSKITENMGLIKKMGVEDAMLATSSAMFKLAATSTAAAGPIVEVTKRLVPVAQASGMATHEILALASASDSLQLMPEVVGTALSKLLMAMQNNHNLIEKSLDIPDGTIAKMIKAGDVMDAMLMIFDKMSGKNMTELSGIWKLLGSDGQRLITVVQAMANHTDTLRKHLETSTQAFKEATAVTEEYNIQQETAAALFQRASNLWRNAMVNADTSLSVKEMAKSWYDFSKSVLSSEFSLSAIKTTIDALLLTFRLLINLLPMVTFGLIAKGAAMLAARLMSAKLAADGFTLSWKKMDAATKSNWIGLAIGLFAQLAFSVAQWAKSNEEAAASQKKLNLAINSATEKAEEEIGKMSRLKSMTEDTTLATEERQKMFSKFKSDYDIYLNYLGIELKSVDELAKHYDALTKVMRQRFAYQEREDYKREIMGGEDGLRMKRRNAGADLKRMGGDIGQDVDLALVDEVVKNGAKTAGEAFVKLFPNIEKIISDRQKTGLSGGRYGDFAKQFAKYFGSVRVEDETSQKIDEAFAQEIGDFDYDKWLRSQVKGDFNLKPDKEALKALRKEQQEEKKALKSEMDQAEKDSTAVINAIEEFYRLQESAVEQLVADGKMTREEADKLIEYVRNRKDEMLMNARRAIAGKDSNFEELRKTMGKDMLRPDDVNSQRAMNTVQTIDVAEAARRLQKFDGSKNVYELNSGAFTQSMLKNAAQNELNIQRRQAAIQEEVDKILLQYEFVEQAQRTFGDKLVKLGLITDGYDKVVQQLADGTEVVANTKDVQALADKTVKMDTRKFYGVDKDDALELRNMIDDLMHTVDKDGKKIRESFASMFPNLDEWMEKPEQYKEQMQAFYKTMIDMDRDYYAALKKNYEKEKREFSERWQAMGWESQEKRENTALDTQENLRKATGQGENFGQTYGFADTIADDPEIARIKNRMEWRAKELEDLRARNASEELIMEKQNEMLKEAAALAEKVSAEVAERVSKIQSLSEPLSSFGEEVGTMLGEQWQGISREGKLTFGQMAKNMGLEYAKLTLKMASENLMKKVQQALFYKQMEMQEMQHQVQMTNIEMQGGSARVAAQASIGAMGLGVQAAQNATEVAAEGSKATVMTMFGISSGSAKTIAQLGWWGIPLIAVITSVLMGLLNSAKATAEQETAASPEAVKNTKTKLVSGMLTYDKGNVQRFIGQDGKVYTATDEPAPKDGLVTHPIATTVQGQPALVAENGPEIVIGRETTKAIMMNEPELIRYLANYQKNGGSYRPYDSGNVQSAAGTQPSDISPQTSDSAEREALRHRLDRSDELMAQVLYYLQNPIPPEIAMYDTGGKKGLHSKMKEANNFMARYGG